MSSIRTDILVRVYFAFGLIVLFAAAVLFKLFQVQVIEGAHWRKEAKNSAIQLRPVEAVRGNIYGVDGSLLATSVPEYDIRIDLLATGIEDNNVFPVTRRFSFAVIVKLLTYLISNTAGRIQKP